jgi:hypothetical protein
MSTFADFHFYLWMGSLTDFTFSYVRLAGEPIKVQSWLLHGRLFQSVCQPEFMKLVDVVFVGFDFTDLDSSNRLETEWLVKLCRMNASMVIVLVATDGLGKGHRLVKLGPRWRTGPWLGGWGKATPKPALQRA